MKLDKTSSVLMTIRLSPLLEVDREDARESASSSPLIIIVRTFAPLGNVPPLLASTRVTPPYVLRHICSK